MAPKKKKPTTPTTTVPTNTFTGIPTPTAGGVTGTSPMKIPANLQTLVRPPYSMSIAAARAFIKSYPTGYTYTFSHTATDGLTQNETPDSGPTLKEALLQMEKDLNAKVPGLGTSLHTKILGFNNIGTKDTATAYDAAFSNLSQFFEFNKVPVNQVYKATATATATTKSINEMTGNELSVYENSQNNATEIAAADTEATGQRQAAQIGAEGQVEAALQGATKTQQASVQDEVMNTLDSWGMASPAMQHEVQNLITRDDIVSQDGVLDIIRASKAYADAFPGLQVRNSKLGPGGEHMTEAQYQEYVSSTENMLGTYGIPENMVTKADIGKLVEGNVSPTEFEARITKGYLAYQDADATTKQLLQSEYNISPGQGVAYFLNPARAQQGFEKDIASASIQSYADEVGLKGLTKQQSQDLFSQMRLTGVTNSTGALANPYSAYTMAQARTDLLNASKNAPLMASNPGESAPTVDTRTLIGSQIAGFDGTNQVNAQTQVERAAQSKAAPFEKGGGYDATAKGVDVGSAPT